MPTYQYACRECGHSFEQFQSFSDDALTECPECGGSLRKLFNAVGVVFKGSGFYRTDSRSSATDGSGSGPDSGSGSGDSGGTSTKESSGAKDSGGGAKESSSPSSTAPAKKPVESGSASA